MRKLAKENFREKTKINAKKYIEDYRISDIYLFCECKRHIGLLINRTQVVNRFKMPAEESSKLRIIHSYSVNIKNFY